MTYPVLSSCLIGALGLSALGNLEAAPTCPHLTPTSNLSSERKHTPIELSADLVRFNRFQGHLQGQVTLRRADQSMNARQVLIDETTSQIQADELVYEDDEIYIQAEQAKINTRDDEGYFQQSTFIGKSRYFQGQAKQLYHLPNQRMTLEQTRYTQCQAAESGWQIKADQITLDKQSGRGTASNAQVEFLGLPIFYSPYLNFPIDQARHSGVLTPRIGRSNKLGLDITLPVYFNMATDRDATFYPRYLSKRGLQLGGEFRYLNLKNSGQINIDYLNNDPNYTGRGSNHRWSAHFKHRARMPNEWELDAALKRVSDDHYFDDFGSGLTLSSQTYLESRLQLSKATDNWAATGLLQDYQDVDWSTADSQRPYARLPHLGFMIHNTHAKLITAMTSELTRFDRNNSLTGVRADFYPSLAYHHQQAGYYIHPKIGIRHTRYQLKNQGAIATSHQRNLPIASIDSGLYYTRHDQWFDQPLTQTLEPRFFYLYIPEKNQSTIPLFDTHVRTQNIVNLFDENRFSGLDRVGDANQLSIGLTSRLINRYGLEKLKMSLGQIYYFSHRHVQLPDNQPDTTTTSPIIAEARYRAHRAITASALSSWDNQKNTTQYTSYQLQYRPEKNKIVNFAYHYQQANLEQTHVALLWPITNTHNRWHLIGAWDHSLRDDKALNILSGVEYENCCWKTRIIARRLRNRIATKPDNSILLELELKGLGNVGDRHIGNLLETNIWGYGQYHSKDDY